MRYTFQPAKLHYWIADGDGELSSRIFRPVCDRSIRRHVDDFKNRDTTDAPDTSKCDTCTEYMAHRAAARSN